MGMLCTLLERTKVGIGQSEWHKTIIKSTDMYSSRHNEVLPEWCGSNIYRRYVYRLAYVGEMCTTNIQIRKVIPYPDGVAIECLWSVDGVYYFHRPECALQYHSDLMEWYWCGLEWHRSASQICKLTPQRHSGVALECTVRVALER